MRSNGTFSPTSAGNGHGAPGWPASALWAVRWPPRSRPAPPSAARGSLKRWRTSSTWPTTRLCGAVLCLLAVICSVAAALATNFATSRSLADRVSAAETSSAQLEGLQVALNFGHIEIDEAVKLYQQYSTQVPFVEGLPRR